MICRRGVHETTREEKTVSTEDPFSLARSGFVKMDDLEDRHILVFPHEVGSRESNIKGQDGEYEYVVCDVIVLDGEVTDMIDEVPCVLEDFQLSGVSVVGVLKPKIKKSGAVLGKLVAGISQYRTRRWELSEPDGAILPTARQQYKAYQESSQPSDPFATAV
jgi:hypothetical protein